MAYNVEKVTKLRSLQQLMEKSKQELAPKTALEGLAAQVDRIIAEGGEPNVINGVKVNGTALEVTDKAVDVPVPVRVSQLDNDSGFQTQAQVQAAVAAVDLSAKQDKLTGTAGQVVGFNAQGQAVAQDAPEGGGLTQAQADGRYLQLTGGTINGPIKIGVNQTVTFDTGYRLIKISSTLDGADNPILKVDSDGIYPYLRGIEYPSEPSDAATKQYVDSCDSVLEDRIHDVKTDVDSLVPLVKGFRYSFQVDGHDAIPIELDTEINGYRPFLLSVVYNTGEGDRVYGQVYVPPLAKYGGGQYANVHYDIQIEDKNRTFWVCYSSGHVTVYWTYDYSDVLTSKELSIILL